MYIVYRPTAVRLSHRLLYNRPISFSTWNPGQVTMNPAPTHLFMTIIPTSRPFVLFFIGPTGPRSDVLLS